MLTLEILETLKDEAVSRISQADFVSAAKYTLGAFVMTESAVWIPTWVFDYMAKPWKKYRVRQPTVYEQAMMDKVRKQQERKRISSYWFLGWFLHLLTWSLSSMSFSDPLPDLWTVVKENFYAIFFLDFYIYLLHWWLHLRHPLGGKKIHDVHHAYRFVGCWYVDHEAGLESLFIASAKYGILAYWSPHPYSAFIYNWIVKFWNVIHHCGHNLPIFEFIDTYFPLIDTPNLHELHHFHHLDGNYAVFFTVFDWFFNTKCRSDVVALTEFGRGKVRHDMIADDGKLGKPEQEDAFLNRKSIMRRFRMPRSTKVLTLNSIQIQKLQKWEDENIGISNSTGASNSPSKKRSSKLSNYLEVVTDKKEKVTLEQHLRKSKRVVPMNVVKEE